MPAVLLLLLALPAAADPASEQDLARMELIRRQFEALRGELLPRMRSFEEFRERYAREGPSRELERERAELRGRVEELARRLHDLGGDFEELRRASRIRMIFTAVEGVTGAGLSREAVGTASQLMVYEDFREELFQLNSRQKHLLADEEKDHAEALAAQRLRRRWQLAGAAALSVVAALALLLRRRSARPLAPRRNAV